MKYTWEKEDVIGGRRVIGRSGNEEYMIGYDPHRPRQNGNFLLFSLIDGMMCNTHIHAQDMADELNKGGFLPTNIIQVADES